MALQELSPAPRNTGLEQLGAVIANAGERYAQTARQDQLLERARSNQLADVQESRNYSDSRFNIERLARLTDQQKLAVAQLRQKISAEAIEMGLLTMDEIDEPVKVEAAVKEMARQGRLEKYKSLLASGALKAADVTNPLAVDTAINVTGERAVAQRANAQAAADDAAAQLENVRGQMAQVMAKITTPPSQAGPTDPEVIRHARALAESIEPGSGRVNDKVAAQIGAATEEINLQRMMQFRQQAEAAKVELTSLRYSEQQLTDVIQQAAQTSQVFPSSRPAPANGSKILQAPQTGGKQGAATPEQIAAAIKAALGGDNEPPPPPADAAAPSNPDMAPAYSLRGASQRAQNFGDSYIGAPLQAVGRTLARGAVGLVTGDYGWPTTNAAPSTLPSPSEVKGAPAPSQILLDPIALPRPPGRPITSAPPVFPASAGPWWSAK